jgi:glucosamine-6-phosphate deaminase
MIRIQILPSEQWAAAAADRVGEAVRQSPSALVGLPTGNTPLPLYAELRRRVAAGEWDPHAMRVVMLDEYLDPPSEEVSSWGWLQRELLEPLGIPSERILRMPWQSGGIEAACARFEAKLRYWGGCDLQLLGLGANGHIAFNEPGSDPAARTRAVPLSPATALANAAYWKFNFRPHSAVSMGIATILDARAIALLVRGAGKAAVLGAALQGPIHRQVPASLLRNANQLYVIADTAAGTALV